MPAARGMELGRVVEMEVEGMSLVRNRKQPFTRAQIEFWQTIKNNNDPVVSEPPGELNFLSGYVVF